MKRTKPSKKATDLRSKAGGRSVGKNGYKIIDWVCSSDLLMGCNQTGLLAATTIVVTALFHIPMQDLLDEYNAFMYNDPAKQIHEYRMSLGMGTERFARKIGTSETCVRSWEKNTKLISRKSWEKYFKGRIK